MIGYIPSYYKCVNIILFLIKPASLPLLDLYWFYSTKRNAISKSDDYHNYYFHSIRLPYILAVTVYIYIESFRFLSTSGLEILSSCCGLLDIVLIMGGRHML